MIPAYRGSVVELVAPAESDAVLIPPEAAGTAAISAPVRPASEPQRGYPWAAVLPVYAAGVAALDRRPSRTIAARR